MLVTIKYLNSSVSAVISSLLELFNFQLNETLQWCSCLSYCVANSQVVCSSLVHICICGLYFPKELVISHISQVWLILRLHSSTQSSPKLTAIRHYLLILILIFSIIICLFLVLAKCYHSNSANHLLDGLLATLIYLYFVTFFRIKLSYFQWLSRTALTSTSHQHHVIVYKYRKYPEILQNLEMSLKKSLSVKRIHLGF